MLVLLVVGQILIGDLRDVEQAVDRADADESPEVDDLDDLPVDYFLHLWVEGKRVELGLVIDAGLVRQNRTVTDIVDLDDGDDAADDLVHSTLQLILQELLDHSRTDLRQMARRHFDCIA